MTDKPNREWLEKMAEAEDHAESVAVGGGVQDLQWKCPLGFRQAVGNVLVQWDLVPNDIKSDPGTNAIAAAIHELEIAWQSVCGTESWQSLHPDQGDPRPPNPPRPEQQREGA